MLFFLAGYQNKVYNQILIFWMIWKMKIILSSGKLVVMQMFFYMAKHLATLSCCFTVPRCVGFVCSVETGSQAPCPCSSPGRGKEKVRGNHVCLWGLNLALHLELQITSYGRHFFTWPEQPAKKAVKYSFQMGSHEHIWNLGGARLRERERKEEKETITTVW